ncbi:MAG: hypothetical protein KA371_20400 [Acidobacteria bacterium]|nr:hypothetical protein [Acidobacteriota bacterium]
MSAQAEVQPAEAPDWFRKCLGRGFQMVPYARGEKGPKGAEAVGWQHHAVKSVDGYVGGKNWGVLLGVEIAPRRFLADCDFDWAPGVSLASLILPQTGLGFGRVGKRLSHAFYTTPQPVVTRQFKDVDGTMLVELRGVKSNGAVGFQTMIPPSIHPTGEPVLLVRDDDIAHVEDLERSVTLFVIACVLAKHLGSRGFGHDVRLAFAAVALRDCGLSEAEAVKVGNALAQSTSNDVDGDDVTRTVQTTADRIKAGERVAGAKELAAALGDNGKKVVAQIRKWTAPAAFDDSAGILVAGGSLTPIVDRVEEALLATPLYQRGGVLTRVIKLDSAVGDSGSVRRAAGSTVLAKVHEAYLVEQMGRVLQWFKPNSTGQVQIDPPSIYARTLLGRAEWRFPVLHGVVTAPTLDRDGRILDRPGFDAASGLLLDLQANAFPAIPAEPSREAALAALGRLAEPLRGFPFVDSAARSVALSAILTALVRQSLRTAPLHGFDAPAAGTGKSYLAETVGLLATGARPPALSQGKSAEEDEKRLSTVLFAGDPVIHLDNCERAVTGDFLCSMLTQEVVQARILGLSERRILPSTALVLASGNNLTLAGDTTRRAVMCRLDANMERPDSRAFAFDCHAEVMANRADLVVAGLTVLRAYVVAGRPAKLVPMGSFSDWEWVRGALVWLGCADPADTRAAILDSDPKRDDLAVVMDHWASALGGGAVEVGDISRRADEEQGAGDIGVLRDALVQVACRGSWSAKSVGWWLRGSKDRVVAGRSFRCEQGRNGQVWRLATEGAACQGTLRVGDL